MNRLSFQVRLLVAFSVIVILTLGGGYLLVNRSVHEAFETFRVRNVHEHDLMVAQFISSYYARTGSWDDISQFLSRRNRPFPYILAGPDDRVIYASDSNLQGDRLSRDELNSGMSLDVEGEQVGTLVPVTPRMLRGPIEATFTESVNRAFWMTGVIAVVVATLLALLLVRQMTGPVRQLDAAAKRISQGDLSERVPVRGSDELARLGHSFNEMADSLQDAEQARQNMIADIAHELRTPISVVQSGLEGMMDGVLEPNQANVAALHGKTLLVSRLVADLQELALADAGRLSIEPERLSLPDVVGHIVATVEDQFDEQDIGLQANLPDGLPQAYVDRHRLEQILINLLSNALQHTPAGGTVTVDATQTDASSIQVSVCDSGSGLTEEDIDQVFDRFYRADKSRSRDSGGTGLGLPIAKAIVEAHGGTIWAEKAPNGGACFRFTLRTASNDSDASDRPR